MRFMWMFLFILGVECIHLIFGYWQSCFLSGRYFCLEETAESEEIHPYVVVFYVLVVRSVSSVLVKVLFLCLLKIFVFV